MSARRKIIVYIATSADGYIARPDGDVEWLDRRPRTLDYGMREFYRTIDTILWGRRTYDWLLNYNKKRGLEACQLRVLANASETSGTRCGVRDRAGEGVRPAAARDSG
jgi:dihydrofolate reductase